MATERWPRLDLPAGEATRDHLRLWSQMLGKTRLAFAPRVNHWWHTTLYVSSRGMTTSAMPIPDGRRLNLELNLIDHRLVARTSDGRSGQLPLATGSIASFYERYLAMLEGMDVHPYIYPRPVEGPDATRFDKYVQVRPYNPDWATAFFGALSEIDRILQAFRGAFIGKASPVHFFWGGFDLAATRFSGRPAPRHRGGIPNCPDFVQLEAYSHECSSAGFWPGGGGSQAALYAYAYPEPPGFSDAEVSPASAFYSRELSEFVLPYEELRRSDDPAGGALAFLQSTYVAAAELAGWDRKALERNPTEDARRWSLNRNAADVSASGHPL